MKKIIYLIFITLIACQHASVLDPQNSSSTDIDDAKQLFDDKMHIFASSSDLILKAISKELVPSWKETIVGSDDNKTTLVVPLANSFEFKITGSVMDRFCVFEKNIKTNTISLNIVLIYSNRILQPDEKIKLLSNHNAQMIPNFNGRIALYDISYRLKEYADYIDGKITRSGIVSTKKDLKDTGARKPSDCTDWYLFVYSNGVLLSVTYLYTQCTCEFTRIGVPGARDGCGGGGSSLIGIEGEPPGYKALAVFTDPCAFKNDMIARATDREYTGILTADGHYLVLPGVGTEFSAEFDGITEDPRNGNPVYAWPVKDQPEVPPYAGCFRAELEGIDCWAVPINAVIHTHPSNASNTVSSGDIQIASDFPSLRFYIIKDGLIAQYSGQSASYGVPAPCWTMY